MLRTFAEPGRVRVLDATNNRLQALPDWLFQRFAGLQQLTLSRNRLAALPAEVGMLTSLKVRRTPLALSSPRQLHCPQGSVTDQQSAP